MALQFTPVTVRVPATSANLGPGFDALGLALSLHDEVEARVTGGGVSVEVSGEGAGDLPTDGSHLVVRAMARVFDELGEHPAGLALRCRNHIPQARGMGSSSAAIVAGVTLARALVTGGAERLDDAGLLRIAAELEGHPDNVAPCLLGGMTIAWTEASGAAAVRLEPAERIRPFVFVPQERGLTEVARAALPATVPHADAALNAGRAALLVHAITVDPAHLFAATEDRLHQAYRAPSMPGSAELVAALRAEGVAAVVSGAGPSVLALTSGDWAPSPVPGWRVLPLDVDLVGALVGADLEWGTLEHADRDPVAAG
ncbi:homoserine kinase [Dactylosporangium aurantiacum]|uniref:Homoserine kinase n=1 Tax=Dactylosporangium aurantiacum TaxID=35754 RepID=A0A9Q9ING8_9ACTN|nr:homoserine kinase [Dactylosporangium aurantiacum]MDG6106098.1 homoserine kinase [Dactylosporangium aurantiacum]UWZ59402.1 homoserine kinase [Dactylosporangium aurantiacum]